MIEPVSGASEAPSPTLSPTQSTSVSSTASIFQSLAAGNLLGSYGGIQETATSNIVLTSAEPDSTARAHARSLENIDDAVVRNLLDSLLPNSRIAGSFFMSDTEEPATKSLIATYYEEV